MRSKNSGRVAPWLLGGAAGIWLLAGAAPAHALPLVTLSGSLRGLYGAALGEQEPSQYGAGLGLRAGVTLPMSLYLGGSFDYFLGDSLSNAGGEIDIALYQLMAHVGYDLGFGPLTLRPSLGLGLAQSIVSVTAGVGGGSFEGDDSEGNFVASPGAELLIGLGLLSVSGELRYNKIFVDGDADALVLGVGVGFSL